MRSIEGPQSATRSGVRQAMRRHLREGSDAAVATVVDVEGSGYRRPGARVVVDPDSEHLGAVTAGCLVNSIVDAAQQTIADGKPRVETFDLRNDGSDSWGLGLGCNGVIDVLVEPLDYSFVPALDGLREKRPVTELTVVASTDADIGVGDRSVLIQGERVSTNRGDLPEPVVDSVKERLNAAEPGTAISLAVETGRGDVRVFANRLVPTPDLLLFGGQRDVAPVASLASQAGFRVHVATARGRRADADRFPAAHEVSSSHPSDLAALVDVPNHTYAVLMSHNFIDDRLALEGLLDTEVPYIGVMGPQKRFDEMRKSMEQTLTAPELDRVAAPCGLDIGGDGPTAVGFSIVSEVIAVHNGRGGGRLTEIEGPIHERSEIA